MGGKILKASLLGGLFAWMWLFVSWAVLPWHCSLVQKFTNETEVAKAINDNSPYSGIYLLPSLCQDGHIDYSEEHFEKGPVIFASIQRYGASLKSFVPYLLSLILQCLGAFLIFLVLLQARRLHYGAKVAISTLIGVIIGVLGALPHWIWWGFPFTYVFVELCDTTIAWLIAGLVMAGFAKYQPPPPKPVQPVAPVQKP